MAEDLVAKAIQEAEQACQYAIASTPAPYRGFITLISQNKRVGGSRGAPQYASIRLPYMTVDGRIKMARDEHRDAEKMLTIQTTFEPVGDYTVCKAVVTSAMLGSAVGHAVVNFGGSGVDASNPIENGESSAIGRALGALGYGLFGTGVASAEEVLMAMSQQARQKVEEMKGADAFVPGPVVATVQDPASEKQLGLLYGKLKQCGVRDGHKRELITFTYPAGISKKAATDLIDFLDKEKTLPSWLRTPYVRFLIKTYEHDRRAVGAYMDKTFNDHDPTGLSKEHFLALVDYLVPKNEQQAESQEDDEPDDIYLPGERVGPMSREEWTRFGLSVCMSERLNNNDFERWAIANFGKGTEENIAQLPREAYNSLVAMDTGKIAEEVKAFAQGKESQASLI